MKLITKIFTRSLVTLIAGCFLIGLIVWAFSPTISKKLADDFLNERGIRTTESTSIRLNPFTSYLTVDNTSLVNGSTETLNIDTLQLKYRFWPLLSKTISIENINLVGAYLDIEKTSSDFGVAGVWLNEFNSEQKTEKPDDVNTEEASPKKASIQVNLNSLNIEDFRLKIKTPQSTHIANINKFSLSEFQLSDQEIKGKAKGFVTIANGNIEFNTDFSISEELSRITSELTSERIELNEFAHWLPEDPRLTDALFGLSFKGTAEIQKNKHRFSSEFLQVSLNAIDDKDALPIIDIGAIEIPSIVISENTIDIESINIANPNIRVNTNTQATKNTVTDTPTGNEENQTKTITNTSNSEDQQKTEPTKNEPSLKINSIALTKPGSIRFEDTNPDTPFTTTITLNSLTLNNINTGDENAVSTFSVEGKDEGYFKFNVNGNAKLFADKTSFNASGNLYEFPLPPVNGYTNKYLGFGINHGHLNSDIKLKAIENQLSGDVILNLIGTKFSSTDEVDTTSVINQSAMPLNIALGFLKDGDGNIKLKVPVKGDLASPEFGMQYIIGLVVKKAAMRQAKSYLVNTFVPYASVVSVALMAGEQALKVRFEDLLFEQGQTNLSEAQFEYMDQLAQLLKDKKNLRIKVCAFATKKEGDSKQAQIKIANARANEFKSYLVEKRFVNSERVMLCEAKIDLREKAQGRVEIDE